MVVFYKQPGVGFEELKGDRREIFTFLFLSGGSNDEE